MFLFSKLVKEFLHNPILGYNSLMDNLLLKYKIYPKKRFGQNFLIDKKVLEKIIKAGNITPKDIILEIGPGTGILTRELVKKAKKIIAVEKDPMMVEILRKRFKGIKNLEIIQKDILKMDSPKKPYKIIANLPYYIVSPLIRRFLEAKRKPISMILMVQKEVGQRICATPPEMSLLAVCVQFYSIPKIISYVSKKAFWPKPKVDSAIIEIKPKLKIVSHEMFFEIVKAGFCQPRKQILNTLSAKLALKALNEVKSNKEKIRVWLLKNKIDPTRRPETLSVEDWIKLAKTYKNDIIK